MGLIATTKVVTRANMPGKPHLIQPGNRECLTTIECDLVVDLFAVRFTKIKNALENSGRKFDLIVNCNSDWLVYAGDYINKKGIRFRELR